MCEIQDMDVCENSTVKVEEKVQEVKNCERKSRTRGRNAGEKNQNQSKSAKKVLSAVTKPSTTLAGKSERFRTKNRNILRSLLMKLVARRNWVEASGVLSVLLKGTCNERSPPRNRNKYWVTMEVLKHIEGNSIKFYEKIQNVFYLWMKRIGAMRKWPIKDKFMAELEFILFCLQQGKMEDAYRASIGLQQECLFGSEPFSNMVVGLTYCQLWYSTIPEELQVRDLGEIHVPMQSEDSHSRCDSTLDSPKSDSSFRGDVISQVQSDTSVRNDKAIAGDVRHKKVPVKAEDNLGAETTYQNYSDHSGEASPSNRGDDMQYDSLFDYHGRTAKNGVKIYETNPIIWSSLDESQKNSNLFNSFSNRDTLSRSNPQHFRTPACDQHSREANVVRDLMRWLRTVTQTCLDSWLLPLRVPHEDENVEVLMSSDREKRNGYYKGAIMHLRTALYSTPPVHEALVPLVQMMLLGNHIDEALNEVNKFEHHSQALLPLRVKVCLLERFDSLNYIKLLACYEEILKKDPTCGHSVAKLASMHQNGLYGTEQLLEVIALHLDATCADSNTWKDFAACFLAITGCEEEQMLICGDGEEEGHPNKEHKSTSFTELPSRLTEGVCGKSWRLRCRWWLNRHFSNKILASELEAGELQLVAYKAASASHMYGPGLEYVVKASTYLKEKDRQVYMFLRLHMQNSIGFYFNSTTSSAPKQGYGHDR